MNDEEKLYILSLEEEIKALRSVLSEHDTDHYEYTQFHKANALSAVRNHLVRPI